MSIHTLSTVHAQENTSVNAVRYPGLESKMCFVTDENMMFKVSLESKYSGSEVYVVIKSKTTQLRYFDMFMGEDGNYFTIPMNIQDVVSRKVGNFNGDIYIRSGMTGIEDDKKVGTVFFYHTPNSCPTFQENQVDKGEKIEQEESFDSGTMEWTDTNSFERWTDIPDAGNQQDQNYILILIPIVVIIAVIVIVKSKKRKVTQSNNYQQKYYYSDSHSAYSKEHKCHFCKKSFARIRLTKITKEFSTKLPEGKYICRECLGNRREEQTKRRFENRRKSRLRDFRTRADYTPLENQHHLREKVTTDEEFDMFIIDLETNANDEFEFKFIENLVAESLHFEFFQRKRASSGNQNKTSADETVDTELEYAYKILDLPINTDWKGVKQRYRELVKQYHPDRNPRDHKQWCDEMMKQIIKAYETIEKGLEKKGK